MRRLFKTLIILLLACVAIVLSAGAVFEWYLKRNDYRLSSKQLATLNVEDDRRNFSLRVAIPKELLSALNTPGRFRLTYRVSDIPDSVKIAFAQATQKSSQESVFSMADPKTWPWNAGDALLDGLPRRRLKALAASASLYLVFYEHGGFGKSDDVAVFRLSGNGARAIWHSFLAPDVANPTDLRNAIRGQAYGDEHY
jgi:hypothetical protein